MPVPIGPMMYTTCSKFGLVLTMYRSASLPFINEDCAEFRFPHLIKQTVHLRSKCDCIDLHQAFEHENIVTGGTYLQCMCMLAIQIYNSYNADFFFISRLPNSSVTCSANMALVPILQAGPSPAKAPGVRLQAIKQDALPVLLKKMRRMTTACLDMDLANELGSLLAERADTDELLLMKNNAARRKLGYVILEDPDEVCTKEDDIWENRNKCALVLEKLDGVPSGYLLALGFLVGDVALAGGLLVLQAPAMTEKDLLKMKMTAALREGAKLKKLVSHIRDLTRRNRTGGRLAYFKALVRFPPGAPLEWPEMEDFAGVPTSDDEDGNGDAEGEESEEEPGASEADYDFGQWSFHEGAQPDSNGSGAASAPSAAIEVDDDSDDDKALSNVPFDGQALPGEVTPPDPFAIVAAEEFPVDDPDEQAKREARLAAEQMKQQREHQAQLIADRLAADYTADLQRYRAEQQALVGDTGEPYKYIDSHANHHRYRALKDQVARKSIDETLNKT